MSLCDVRSKANIAALKPHSGLTMKDNDEGKSI